jgi:SEC-C motif-containing protein
MIGQGRNEPCSCGSGRKYKHCCLEKDDGLASAARATAAAEGAAQSAVAVVGRMRAPKHNTQQPWKTTTSRGFVGRSRTPRKVGGG